MVLACSSAGYGDVNHEDCPLIEERFLRPNSPYGVSKVATENLGYQYYTNYGLKVYLPRLFIHVGTGHPPATPWAARSPCSSSSATPSATRRLMPRRRPAAPAGRDGPT